jgi:hypothetical protein
MNTISERIEAAKKRAAEQAADLEKEAAILKILPPEPEPYMIHFFNSEPWISYKADTVSGLATVLRLYEPIAASAYEAGCVYVGPDAKKKAGERAKLKWETERGLVEISLQRGRGFSTSGINFWTVLSDGRTARVKAELDYNRPWPSKASPQCSVSYDSHGEVRSARHELPDLGEWRRIKWGGGSQDACMWSLYFDGRQEALDWLTKIEAEQ